MLVRKNLDGCCDKRLKHGLGSIYMKGKLPLQYNEIIGVQTVNARTNEYQCVSIGKIELGSFCGGE